MVLALCIGDLHIPHRASDLPPKFKELLQPGKIHHVLCPGNLCSREVLDYLKTICSSIHFTRGDFDDVDAPEEKVVAIEDFRVGLCHGHQVVPCGDTDALGILLRRMDVDILITGHTHKFQVEQFQDYLLMNPGSGTGAYSMFGEDRIPSFALMDINGSKVDVYIYEMINEEFKIRKMEYNKPSRTNSATAAIMANGGGASVEVKTSVPSQPKPLATEKAEVREVLADTEVGAASKESLGQEPLKDLGGSVARIETLPSVTSMGPDANGAQGKAEEKEERSSTPPPIPKPDQFAEVTFGDEDQE